MAAATAEPVRSGYIASPASDWFFLIGAPLVAVVAFLPFAAVPMLRFPTSDPHFGGSFMEGFIAVVIYAHLFLVFFRSHANPAIFRAYPFRFAAVPLLLFAAVYTSTWALIVIGVIGVWWDVYHSALQTFGIGRIYDLRAGNDLEAGRRLDQLMNVLLYAGPILGGASLALHMEAFSNFNEVGSAFFTSIPARAESNARWLTLGVLALGIPFSIYYCWRYWQMRRRGYRVSLQKASLYAIVAVVSIACWGFNSFGEAFFVMNFFHALQYFFIVWHTEGTNLTTRFGLSRLPQGRYLMLALFIATGLGYGIWTTGAWPWPELQPSRRGLLATLLTVSILHFWYDGFIWSVRRGQVR
jgi:hypothetical protein